MHGRIKQKQQNLQEYFQNILDQKADTECAYQQQGPRARDEFWEESYSKSMILEAVSSRVLG